MPMFYEDMLSSGTVIRRYENKYLIPESLCDEIRDYISFFCIPDPNAESGNGSYYVHSLYFDTPELGFFWDNRNRLLVRTKPRVRYFGLKPADFVVLEVKRRVKNIVLKKREVIPVDSWPGVLDSYRPDNRMRNMGDGPFAERYVESFLEVVNAYGAVPVVHVRYLREAYVSEIDDYVRITFDRQLSGCLAHGSYDLVVNDDDFVWVDDPATSNFFESPVIMEIKCEPIFPRWIVDLVQKFRLYKQGFSKYCNTLEKAHAEFFGNGASPFPRFG